MSSYHIEQKLDRIIELLERAQRPHDTEGIGNPNAGFPSPVGGECNCDSSGYSRGTGGCPIYGILGP